MRAYDSPVRRSQSTWVQRGTAKEVVDMLKLQEKFPAAWKACVTKGDGAGSGYYVCLEAKSNGTGIQRCQRPRDGAAKPTNPADIVATTKLPLHLVPMITQAYFAIGHFNGLGSMAAVTGAWAMLASIYVSAALRHINSWNEGRGARS